jgi:hypothetical protein
MPSSGVEVGGLHLALRLGGEGRARDFPSGLNSLRHFLPLLGGKAEVTPWAEVRCDETIRGEKALSVPGRLEPLHPLCPLPHRLMGVLRPIEGSGQNRAFLYAKGSIVEQR